MKKILIIALSFLSIGVAFSESDYLSSQGYISNKAFVGETNKEFAEAFGVATFKDEKSVFDLSLDFAHSTRTYSNLRLNIKDKSGTVSYIENGEKTDTLNCKISGKSLKDDIAIIRTYKDNTKALTRVIFSAKIVQE